ncbi:MAG: hypothetical protein ACK476_05895, partial [Fluviicola sp.]
LRILDFLKKGALVELLGTPFAKTFTNEDGTFRAEIRLNVSKTNILRAAKCEDDLPYDMIDNNEDGNCDDTFDSGIDDFTLSVDDF